MSGREQNVVDITGNGGGEETTSNNVVLYDLPSSPQFSVAYGRLVNLKVHNLQTTNAEFLIDDKDAVGESMSAITLMRFNVNSGESVFLNEDDMGDIWLNQGLIVQGIPVSGTVDMKASAEVEVI